MSDTGEFPAARQHRQLIADLKAARDVVATGVSAGDAVARAVPRGQRRDEAAVALQTTRDLQLIDATIARLERGS